MASVGDLPAALFSPSKLVYLSYVILTGLKILPAPPLWLFVVVSAGFLVFEVGHNDYLRIVLNGFGEKQTAEILKAK